VSRMQDHRRLRVWQRATDNAVAIYDLTRSFPKHEQFGLSQQMRRSAVSIASNIAEGAGRESRADFRRFCFIALGSAHELECQLEIAFRLGFGSGHSERLTDTAELIRMLGSLVQALDTAG